MGSGQQARGVQRFRKEAIHGTRIELYTPIQRQQCIGCQAMFHQRRRYTHRFVLPPETVRRTLDVGHLLHHWPATFAGGFAACNCIIVAHTSTPCLPRSTRSPRKIIDTLSWVISHVPLAIRLRPTYCKVQHKGSKQTGVNIHAMQYPGVRTFEIS